MFKPKLNKENFVNVEFPEKSIFKKHLEEIFDREVKKASKYFNADIYDTCATCGNLTKNDICKECSKE